jgi:ubiquinol-cytochrome c reductase iron-sulfur subunit
MSSNTGGQQPSPPTNQTSAEAAGSIRDRLAARPSDEANSGGDSRTSDVNQSAFQQTYSVPADEQQRSASHTPQAVESLGGETYRDLTPAESKSAERKVSALFLLSVLGFIGFVVTYVAVPSEFGERGNVYYTPLLGTFMALSLFGIGAGAVLWAKLLMPDEEAVQERHPFGSPPEERAATAAAHKEGFKPYQNKEIKLAKTGWKEGVRLIRQNGTPVKLGDLVVGAVESVFPDVEHGTKLADSPALLIRMRPEELSVPEDKAEWVYEGHIVYSSICTHLGCPVKLYEQQTHHLFCPCHQSTFDASKSAKVLFGPAARPLPQLAISVDEEGYFVAQGDFAEPTGPSYWERG